MHISLVVRWINIAKISTAFDPTLNYISNMTTYELCTSKNNKHFDSELKKIIQK
jgi:hypothetical protein